MDHKYALVIGINYTGSRQQLRGCVNDAINIRNLLHANRYPRQNIWLMTDNSKPNMKPTRQNIQREFERLIKRSNKNNGNTELFLHYSGHGSYTFDHNNDEDDRRDELLIPIDYRDNGYIHDDYIHSVLRLLNKKSRLTMLFDCCHSGTIADIKFQTTIPGKFTIENKRNLPGEIIMYSGCQDLQLSADAYNINQQRKWSGAMTSSFIRTVKNFTTAKKIGVFETLQKMREFIKTNHYTQIPQLSSNKKFDQDRDLFGPKGYIVNQLPKPDPNKPKLSRRERLRLQRLRRRRNRREKVRKQREAERRRRRR